MLPRVLRYACPPAGRARAAGAGPCLRTATTTTTTTTSRKANERCGRHTRLLHPARRHRPNPTCRTRHRTRGLPCHHGTLGHRVTGHLARHPTRGSPRPSATNALTASTGVRHVGLHVLTDRVQHLHRCLSPAAAGGQGTGTRVLIVGTCASPRAQPPAPTRLYPCSHANSKSADNATKWRYDSLTAGVAARQPAGPSCVSLNNVFLLRPPGITPLTNRVFRAEAPPGLKKPSRAPSPGAHSTAAAFFTNSIIHQSTIDIPVTHRLTVHRPTCHIPYAIAAHVTVLGPSGCPRTRPPATALAPSLRVCRPSVTERGLPPFPVVILATGWGTCAARGGTTDPPQAPGSCPNKCTPAPNPPRPPVAPSAPLGRHRMPGPPSLELQCMLSPTDVGRR